MSRWGRVLLSCGFLANSLPFAAPAAYAADAALPSGATWAAPSESCDRDFVQKLAPAGATVAFAAREYGRSGAKMIVWHGSYDGANSYLDDFKAYEAVRARAPGAANRGETGKAPEEVLASRATPQKGVDRVCRLCAEPARAMLKRAGLDPNAADNWECRRPV